MALIYVFTKQQQQQRAAAAAFDFVFFGERGGERGGEREKRYVVYTHPVVYGSESVLPSFFLIFSSSDSIPTLPDIFLKHSCIHKVIRYIHPMDIYLDRSVVEKNARGIKNSQQPIFQLPYLPNLLYLTDLSIEPGTVHNILYLTRHQEPVAPWVS